MIDKIKEFILGAKKEDDEDDILKAREHNVEIDYTKLSTLKGIETMGGVLEEELKWGFKDSTATLGIINGPLGYNFEHQRNIPSIDWAHGAVCDDEPTKWKSPGNIDKRTDTTEWFHSYLYEEMKHHDYLYFDNESLTEEEIKMVIERANTIPYIKLLSLKGTPISEERGREIFDACLFLEKLIFDAQTLKEGNVSDSCRMMDRNRKLWSLEHKD